MFTDVAVQLNPINALDNAFILPMWKQFLLLAFHVFGGPRVKSERMTQDVSVCGTGTASPRTETSYVIR